MSTTYPENFPISEIRTLVDLVRNNKIKGNLDDFAFSIWVVQGYGQKALLGVPNGTDDSPVDDETTPDFSLTLMKAPAEVDETVALQALETLANDQPAVQAAVPWDIILPYLLKLLTDWLSKQD